MEVDCRGAKQVGAGGGGQVYAPCAAMVRVSENRAGLHEVIRLDYTFQVAVKQQFMCLMDADEGVKEVQKELGILNRLDRSNQDPGSSNVMNVYLHFRREPRRPGARASARAG